MKRIIAFVILAAFFLGGAAARDLDEIKASGKLIVGLRKTATTWAVDPKTGAESGFTYELASAFASGLGLKLEIVTIPTFGDLWKKDGAIPAGFDKDPSVVYTPDIYREIDVAAEILSPQPWREKLVELVPFIENTDIVLARKDLNLGSNRDLPGKRVFLVTGMSSYAIFTAKMKELGQAFVEEAAKLVAIDTEPRLLPVSGSLRPVGYSGPVHLYMLPAGTPFKSFTGIWLIQSGQADFGLADYLSILLQLWENPAFRDLVVPAYSFSGQNIPLCFSLAKDSPRLKAELAAFFSAMKSDGRFSALVKKYTGFTYDEYKSIMGAR